MCECGWSDSSSSLKVAKVAERKTIRVMIAAAVTLIAVYGHLLNWGSYAVEIPFVKAGQITGLLSKEGYRELAAVCIKLNKWSCAKEAYTDLFTSKQDVEGLAERASLEYRLGESEIATATYASYFAAGGKNSDASYLYGYLLESAGRPADAQKAYEFGITNAGDRLPVRATTGLVQLLIKQGRYDEALSQINAFHESAGNAAGYLNTEREQLENQLSLQAKR